MKQSVTLTVISITHAGMGKVTIVMSATDGSANYNTTVTTADADAVRVGSQYTLSVSPAASSAAV